MSDHGYFAVGNDELANMPPLKIGDAILCPQCGGSHIVDGGADLSTGEKTDRILFYECDGKSYLAGVAGKNVMSRFMGKEE